MLRYREQYHPKKLLKFLNKPSKSLKKGLQPQLIRYDGGVDTEAPN